MVTLKRARWYQPHVSNQGCNRNRGALPSFSPFDGRVLLRAKICCSFRDQWGYNRGRKARFDAHCRSDVPPPSPRLWITQQSRHQADGRVYEYVGVYLRKGNRGSDLTKSRPLDRYIAHFTRRFIPRTEQMGLLCRSPKSPMSHNLHGHDRFFW